MVSKKLASTVAMGFGLAGFCLGIVSLATDQWLQSASGSNNGLWNACDDAGVCTEFSIGENVKYRNYETVRGFGVLAVTMLFGGLIISIISFKKWLDATITATFYLMGAFFALIAYAMFTSISQGVGDSYGYSFGVGWASFPCALLAGVVMTYVEFTSD